MPYKFNPLTGNLDYYKDSNFRGVSATAPSSPQEGWTYIDSDDNGYYIYYGESWQLLHTLTPAALNFLLLESGDILLKEDGDKLALQS
jgi:hypothetical protein